MSYNRIWKRTQYSADEFKYIIIRSAGHEIINFDNVII